MTAFCRHSSLVMPSYLFIGLVLVTVVAAWSLSYLVDWLYRLEAGTRGAAAEGYLEDPTALEKVPLPSIFAPAEKYLSLILPAFEEELRLPLTLDESIRYFQQRAALDKAFTFEIVVVDDGSKDRTVQKALEYVKKYGLDCVRVVRQGVNQGKGAAVRKGMLCSRGEILLFADSDGATRINDVEKLEAELRAVAQGQLTAGSHTTSGSPGAGSGRKGPTLGGTLGAVFGSRAHLEEEALAKRKWYRNFLMFGFHFCVLLVAGPGVRDTQCGFKMFTRAAARQLFPNQRLNRWCFDVELVYLCKRLRIPVKEVSVNWTEIPGSKIRFTSILHMLLELLLVRLGYGSHVWKIRRDFNQ